MCVCVCVFAVAHILSPVQIKPLPTISSDDKQEDGGAWSPDGRLEGPPWHKGRDGGGWGREVEVVVGPLRATTPRLYDN